MRHLMLYFAVALGGIAAALPVPVVPWKLPDGVDIVHTKPGYNIYGRKLGTNKLILTFMTQDEALDIFQEGLKRAREKMALSDLPEAQRDYRYYGKLWDEVMREMKINVRQQQEMNDALDDLNTGERELRGLKRKMVLNGISRHLPSVAKTPAELSEYEALLEAKRGELNGLKTVTCALQSPLQQCVEATKQVQGEVSEIEQRIRNIELTVAKNAQNSAELERLQKDLVGKKAELKAADEGRCRSRNAFATCRDKRSRTEREIERLQTLVANTKKKWAETGGPIGSRMPDQDGTTETQGNNNLALTSAPPTGTTEKKTGFAGVQWPQMNNFNHRLNALMSGAGVSRSLQAGGRLLSSAAVL